MLHKCYNFSKGVDKMQGYTVKQIAEMLNTNPETVRRWIRAGKLKAVQNSKKAGNLVSSESLQHFLKSTPKYAEFVTATAIQGVATVAMAALFPATMSLLMGGLMKSAFQKGRRKVVAEDIELYLQKESIISTKTIRRKTEMSEQLQKEIEEEQAKLEGINQILQCEDLGKVAEEISAKINT